MLVVDDQIQQSTLSLEFPCQEDYGQVRMEEKPKIAETVQLKDPISAYSFIGKRRTNQDKFDVKFHGNDILIAVFDGHGTGDIVQHVWGCLLNSIISNFWYATDLTKAMSQAIKLCQETVLHKSGNFNSADGCVALVAILRNRKLFLANIGDCRAIKIYKQLDKVNFMQLTKDHIPENPTELQMIRERGGVVLKIKNSLRVNGEIRVTRSIGDKKLKGPLSSEPQIFQYLIGTKDQMLILGTDGFWNTVPAHVLTEMAWKYRNSINVAASIGKQLMHRATDNLTIICIRL